MKIRYGFVSNSSSTSFTCLICGREDGGFEACLEDCEMTECDMEHTMCQICVDDYDKIYKEAKEKHEKGYFWFHVPTDKCPVCQFKTVDPYDGNRYMMKELGFANRKELDKAILDRFGSYQAFNKYMSGK